MGTQFSRSMMPPQVVFVALAAVLLFGSCTPRDSGQDDLSFVKFRIGIARALFSEEAVVSVQLWDKHQLAIRERMRDCVATYDAETKTQTVQCPRGIAYEQARPEEFQIHAKELPDIILLESRVIKPGEPYRIQIAGQSEDGCNMTSAADEGIAEGQIVEVFDLVWETTLMGCVSPP